VPDPNRPRTGQLRHAKAHGSQNLIRRAPGKASLRLKRKTAGWDDDFLAELIER
jgi:hypothetical protein